MNNLIDFLPLVLRGAPPPPKRSSVGTQVRQHDSQLDNQQLLAVNCWHCPGAVHPCCCPNCTAPSASSTLQPTHLVLRLMSLAQGRESHMPPLEVAELTAACIKGAYNSCIDLAVQVRLAAQPRSARGRPQAQTLCSLLAGSSGGCWLGLLLAAGQPSTVPLWANARASLAARAVCPPWGVRRARGARWTRRRWSGCSPRWLGSS